MSDEASPLRVAMNDMSFATAINCMDGRVQLPVFEYLKTAYGVDYVDMITEPGPLRILAQDEVRSTVESIRIRVAMSVSKHNSKLIALVGHYDCAGNPVGKKSQMEQMSRALKFVEAWKFGAQVIGLWVDKNWEVIEVGSL